MASAMEAKLAIRRYHGGRVCWLETSDFELLNGLIGELLELCEALKISNPEEIRWEAVDVANRAMMIADKYGICDVV